MPWFSSNGTLDNYPRPAGYSAPANIPGPSRGILARLRQVTSGWLGPKLSEGTEVGRELVREKAAGGPRGIFDLPWFLPYIYDNYTQETTAHRAAYRTMWADSNVKSACAGKIMSVAGLDLKFQPADKKNKESKRDADFCDYVFNERIKGVMPDLVWSILVGACTDGYSVSEKVWGHEDQGKWAGNWIIRALKPQDTLNDIVLQTDPYKNITGIMGLRYNAGMEFAPANFVIYRHMPLFNQPVGMSDFRSVYKDYWLLDTAKKMRAVGLEKRSYPFIIGKWQTASDQPGLEGALAKAKWQNFISMPKTAEAEALDLAGQGDRIFDEAIKSLKHDIWLGIRFAVLQSLEGTTSDARGNSQVHKESSEVLERFLAASLCQIFNDRECGLIKDVLDPNYICHEYPKAVISEVDINEMEAEARIDTALHTFLPLSADECYERYGRTPPQSPEDTIAPASANGSAGSAGIGQSAAFGADVTNRLDMALPKNRIMGFSEGGLDRKAQAIMKKRQAMADKYGEDVATAILRAAADLSGSINGNTEATTFAEERPGHSLGSNAPVQLVLPKPEAPIVNVQIPPQPRPIVHAYSEQPNIVVNVPKQEPPNVVVNVPAPEITVEMPEQPAPVIKVDVQPAPVHVEIPDIKVEMPKSEGRKLRIKRDREGNIEAIHPE